MNANSKFDREEALRQVEEVIALINNLRPDPAARYVSREKLALMAALAGTPPLVQHAMNANENTIFWELHGQIIRQVVSLTDLRVA